MSTIQEWIGEVHVCCVFVRAEARLGFALVHLCPVTIDWTWGKCNGLYIVTRKADQWCRFVVFWRDWIWSYSAVFRSFLNPTLSLDCWFQLPPVIYANLRIAMYLQQVIILANFRTEDYSCEWPVTQTVRDCSNCQRPLRKKWIYKVSFWNKSQLSEWLRCVRCAELKWFATAQFISNVCRGILGFTCQLVKCLFLCIYLPHCDSLGAKVRRQKEK